MSPAAESTRRPAVRTLAAFVLANFVLAHVALLVVKTPVEDTGILPIAWFFTARQGHDSWDSMALGYAQATTPHARARPFYWRTFFSPQVVRKGFQYPPSALLVVSGLHAVLGEGWPGALRVITWAMVPLTALFVWMLYEARGGGPAPGSERALAALTAALATLTFYPVMRAYANGQMQAWLNAAFAMAVWCWATGRRGWAGALVALGCAVKPQLGLFVLWAALRRQWSFLAAWAATAAALLAASVALYGWSPHVEYLGVLRFLGERGEAFFPNQSVNGLVNRWLLNGDILSWRQPWVEHFPPYDGRVFWATVASSLVLVTLGLTGPGARGERGGVIDFCLMGLAATLASPIAWEHHYGVLLPMFVAASAALARAGARSRWGVALAVAYVLTSNCFWVTKRLASTRLNVFESYLFFGALVLLIVLMEAPLGRESRRMGPGEVTA